MNLFEGLIFYEIVLLCLGVLFFFVLLFVLIYFVIKNRPIKAVIPLFLVSVIMISFPGIQKIKFDNGVIEIEKLTQEVEQNPGDSEAKKELANKLSKIENRPVLNPLTIKKLEKAFTAIGDTRKATILKDKLRIIKPVRRE